MALPRDWSIALGKAAGQGLKEIGNAGTGAGGVWTGAIDIGTFTSLVYGILMQNIMASTMPAGAKSAILNAVSGPQITSPTTGIIHINSVMRPSVFSILGASSRYGMADLVMVYNKRKGPKAAAYPVEELDDERFKWARMSGQMVIAHNNLFLEKTVAEGNSLSPYGVVTLVK